MVMVGAQKKNWLTPCPPPDDPDAHRRQTRPDEKSAAADLPHPLIPISVIEAEEYAQMLTHVPLNENEQIPRYSFGFIHGG